MLARHNGTHMHEQFHSNQHHRLQNFIDSAFLLAEHTQEKIELLMVEWNPPNDRRRIMDSFVSTDSEPCFWICAVNWRKSNNNLFPAAIPPIRILDVPNHYCA